MSNFNANIFPPGGYFFVEPSGVRLKAGSWLALSKKVQAFRKANKLPFGDPLREVLEQACKRTSSACGPAVEVPAAQSLKARVLNWLSSFRARAEKEELKKVTPEEAARRAAVCAKCPKRMVLTSNCSSCSTAIRAMRDLILKRKPLSDALEACDHFGIDLPTAVFLDESRIQSPGAPAGCFKVATA